MKTDAYAYLDIDKPLCAWSTYRGVLVSAPNKPGFTSVWTAGLLEDGRAARIAFEHAVENVRSSEFRDRISRLRGMFCLDGTGSAQLAGSWDEGRRTHFRPDYLAELSLCEATAKRDRLDANWITHAPVNDKGFLTDFAWIPRYWAGDQFPGREPIWEILVEGRMIVLGTDLRKRAYEAVKIEFPDSLCLLEISRLAARVGYDVGVICSYLRRTGDQVVLEYLMNMEDAEDPAFLGKLKVLLASGHPVNQDDIQRHFENGSFGAAPDLRPYSFRRPLGGAMPVPVQSS